MKQVKQMEMMSGNFAAAQGARLIRAKVIPVYPITPQTSIVEHLIRFVADGLLDAQIIHVESEHSVLAAASAACDAGSRAYWATSSHGLALANELFWGMALMRRPLVGVIVSRFIGPPWNIKTDSQDILSVRDTGAIIRFARNVQEILDFTIMGCKIAEDRQIRLPWITGSEAFYLSHAQQGVYAPGQELVDEFLPPFKPTFKIDFDDPRSFGGLVDSEPAFWMKIDIQQAMERVLPVTKKVQEEFSDIFGRRYEIVEKLNWDNPDTVLVTSGTPTNTALHLLTKAKKEFANVGVLNLEMFRPFPAEDVRRALEGVERVAVIDRNISLGKGGIICQEVKSALFSLKERPMVQGYIAGLAGYDITRRIITSAIKDIGKRRDFSKEIVFLPEGIEKQIPGTFNQSIKTGNSTDSANLICGGHNACHGCGEMIGARMVLGSLGPHTAVYIPAGCTTITSGVDLQTALKVPSIHVCFETAAPSASGMEAALIAQGREDVDYILILAGDGATADIGLGGSSALIERLNGTESKIIYVCLDNEAYMNTGAQRSGATPYGAWTTTTPQGKLQFKKPIVDMFAINGASLSANASIAYPKELREILEIAKRTKIGLKFINLLVPCPTGWGFPPSQTIEMGRLAVETGVYPLYYILDGRKWIINREPKFLPVEEYLKKQKRFKHLTEEDIETIQNNVYSGWDWLRKLSQL